MRLRSRLAPLVFALSVFSISSAAYAQNDADKATARQLGQEGQEAFEKKDFKTAEDRFKRADSLFHAPTLALGLARAYAANAKFVEAQETYNRIIREGAPAGSPPAFQNAVDSAKAEVASVAGKIGSVVISVTGAESPKVTLDDQPFPNAALGVKRAANPGAHVVRATADGYKSAEARVTVTEAGSATATLTLEKDPNAVAAPPVVGPAPGPGPGPAGPTAPVEADTGGGSTKTIGLVLMGVGGVGLVAGGITGAIAMSKHSSLNTDCPDGKCPADKKSAVDSYKTMGTISTVGFIVGGVALAGGAVLFFTAPKEKKSAFVRPVFGPTASANGSLGGASIGAVGQF